MCILPNSECWCSAITTVIQKEFWAPVLIHSGHPYKVLLLPLTSPFSSPLPPNPPFPLPLLLTPPPSKQKQASATFLQKQRYTFMEVVTKASGLFVGSEAS